MIVSEYPEKSVMTHLNVYHGHHHEAEAGKEVPKVMSVVEIVQITTLCGMK